MRLLPRSPWLQLLLIWTVVIWVAIVLLVVSASISYQPCNPIGGGNPDPALPMCGIDDVAPEGILAVLLFVVWLGGIVVEAVVFTISRLAHWLRRGSGSSSE